MKYVWLPLPWFLWNWKLYFIELTIGLKLSPYLMCQSILFTIICIINLENVIITESISYTPYFSKKCLVQKYISSRINVFDAANTFLFMDMFIRLNSNNPFRKICQLLPPDYYLTKSWYDLHFLFLLLTISILNIIRNFLSIIQNYFFKYFTLLFSSIASHHSGSFQPTCKFLCSEIKVGWTPQTI